MMEEELVARLLEAEALKAIFGDRIHWVDRPEGEGYPALTLQIATFNPDYTHDGRSALQYPRIQFDSWANTYGDAKVGSRAVLTEMERVHEGDLILFEDAICITDQDMPKESLEGGTEIFRVSQDFLVPFRPINQGA